MGKPTIDRHLFADAEKARQWLERVRWPNGPVCPHCGAPDAYRLESHASNGKRATRPGLLKCKACRKQFTVTVGTIFAQSHIPLNKWLEAVYLMCSSKKGISTNQLAGMLGLSYRSAWHLTHRVRLAMTQSPLVDKLAGIVEADETYVGGKKSGGKRGRGAPGKVKVFALLQRDGQARSFTVPNTGPRALQPIIRRNVSEAAHIVTDSWHAYRGLDKPFAQHSVINKAEEGYVRGIIHTNFAESYFSLLKRGIFGTYHHISRQHFEKYLAEFNFKWNRRSATGFERTVAAIAGAEGKRLTLRQPVSASVPGERRT